MTARLAGGVNLNYLRLDSPDHHPSTAGDHLIYPVTDRWINGIDQGEIASPIKVSDPYPTISGKNIPIVYLLSILHSHLVAVQYSFKPDNKLAHRFL